MQALGNLAQSMANQQRQQPQAQHDTVNAQHNQQAIMIHDPDLADHSRARAGERRDNTCLRVAGVVRNS